MKMGGCHGGSLLKFANQSLTPLVQAADLATQPQAWNAWAVLEASETQGVWLQMHIHRKPTVFVEALP